MLTKSLKTYYLQMLYRPDIHAIKAPKRNLRFMQAKEIPLSYYKYLFIGVGKKWRWVSRLHISDEELKGIIHDKGVEIHVLYYKGAPAGFYELDCRDKRHIELVFFGLMEDFIGKGLGKTLIKHAIDRAWIYNPKKFWLHTCELDSTHALSFYEKNGFEIYNETKENVTLPEENELEEFYSFKP